MEAVAPDRWVDLLDPSADDLDRAVAVELHRSAVEQLLEPARAGDEPRPKIDTHGSYLFAVLLVPVLVAAEDRTYLQEVDLIVTSTCVVTVRKTPCDERGKPNGDPPYDPVTLRQSLATHGDRSPGMLAFVVADDVAEAYLDLVDGIHDEVDELEDRVTRATPTELQRAISDLRHDLLRLRRTLAPTRDAFRRVVDGRIDLAEEEVFPRAVELHFADAYDKLLRAAEGMETARDLVGGVRDYLQATVANEQNEVTKRLAVIASMLLVPTFIVGLYGQNFAVMPELSWHYGYAFSWVLIVGSSIGQFIYFRWRRWI